MVFFGPRAVGQWIACAARGGSKILGSIFVAGALAASGSRAHAQGVPVAVAVEVGARVDFEEPSRGWNSAVPGWKTEAVGISGRAGIAEGGGSKRTWRDIVPVYDHPVRPFSEFGAAVKLSTLGPGFDLVTPLLRGVNLRASANFFDFGLAVTNQGVTYHGELHMRSGGASLDWFPRHGGFHVSPGLMIFNPRIGGGITIPGGMQYTLNDQTFTSSATDPIHGDAQLAFTRRLAPALAIGFANIIPRSGKRWTVPVELGAAYIGPSSISILLAGTACQPSGCEDVATDPDSQTDLQEQVREINEDLKRAQIFPIVSIGIGYRF